MRFLLLLLLLLPGIARAATSNVTTSSRDSVSLVSQTNAAANGVITLGLRFQLAPGWHIYWSNPGDAGYTPHIALDPPASAGAFSYPPPELLMQGPVAAYVLSGDVLLPFTASNVGDSVTASANWLVCRDVCVPEHAHFSLALNGGASAEAKLFTGPPVVASPFTARLLTILRDDIAAGGASAELALGWPGDPVADALALRMAGALHALALTGSAPALVPCYPPSAAPVEPLDRKSVV